MIASPTVRRNLDALRRILAFAIFGFLAIGAVEILIGPVIAWIFGVTLRGVATDSYVFAIGLLFATAATLRYHDKRRWSDIWMGRAAAAPSRLAYGLAIGSLAIAVPTALLVASGWLRNDGGLPGSWWAAAFRITLTLLPAALLEELLTRGYVLAVLRETWGWLAAVVVTSVAFGLLHLQNEGATAESVAAVTLAGFFLAAILYATKSLYATWMAHFAWNWTMAVLFHTAVSGYPMEAPRYRYVDAGPDWATGGVWGPESGVPAELGMVAGMSFLFARRKTQRRVD